MVRSHRQILVNLFIVVLMISLFVSCTPATETEIAAPSPTEKEPSPTEKEPSVSASPTSEEVQVEPPAPLVIAVPLDILSLDPTSGREPYHFGIDRAIYDGLYEMDMNMEVQPNLAVSYEILDDTTWQFKLKEGVIFHNGELFNAEAVKFSIEHALREGGINRSKTQPIVSAEVIDEYTVNITTSVPDPVLLSRLAFPCNYIVPPQYIEENGVEYFETHPIGTGPFMFKEWTTDGYITLERFSDYHRELPSYETIIIRPIPVDASRVAALEAGEIDVAVKIPPNLAQTLEGNPNIQLVSVPGSRTYYFGMVNKREDAPTADRLVRLALNHAVDVDTILEEIYMGYGQRVGVAPFGPDSFGYDPSIPPFEYNPDKAKELLAEAGYEDGVTLDLGYPVDYYLFDKQLVQALQAQFASVGVTANIKAIERGAYWEMYREVTLPEVYMESMGSYFADADLPLKTIIWSESWLSQYYDPLVDELIEKAGSTLDQDLRLDYYSQLQEEFAVDPPMIILFQLENICGLSNRVKGFTARADEFIDWRDISLE